MLKTIANKNILGIIHRKETEKSFIQPQNLPFNNGFIHIRSSKGLGFKGYKKDSELIDFFIDDIIKLQIEINTNCSVSEKLDVLKECIDYMNDYSFSNEK